MAQEAMGLDSLVGQCLGHYRIVEKIGEGGMGRVYRARDQHLERDVAIKILPQGAVADDAARKHFRKEALALSRLNHPNVETIFDFDSEQGCDFIVTEYIAGQALSQKLASGGLLERDLSRLGSQMADGLAVAHDQGIIHRDLKPSNLLITADGRLKILDFGLAKLVTPVTSDDATASMSESMRFAGTLPYMAPEQVRGEPLDARSDIWAAGAVLYEMATGLRPFRATGLNVTDEILHHEPAAPSTVTQRLSPALDAVILKCLDKEPENRYQSTRELAIDLRRLATPSTATVISLPKRKMRPRKLALGFALLVAIATAAAYAYFNYPHRQITSVAVLPLVNLSGDPQQEYFADGMTDALIARLAQIKALKVISRTSTMHYKGTHDTLAHIAKELGVDGIVEASVVRSADHVRIRAQLIDVRQQRHLWEGSYDRNMSDVLMLQSDVVQEIASEIQAQITPQETERLKKTRTVDPQVYDNTLRGRATLEYATGESQIRQAIDLFEKAVERDPTYAAAWAGLGEARWMLAATGFEFVPPDEVRDSAIAAANKALELDGSLPEAHEARAVIAVDGDWNLEVAEQHFRKALELRPGYAAAHNSYAQILEVQLARFDEARWHLDLARQFDPLSPWNDLNLVVFWLYQGRPDKALDEARSASQMHPSLWIVPTQIGGIQLIRGRPDQALPQYESALKLVQSERPMVLLASLGLAYGLAGRQSDALRILEQLRQASHESYISPLYLAVVYSGLGKMDEAFQLLDQALEQRVPSLVFCAMNDPSYVALRRDPRWLPFMTRLGQKVRLPPGTRNPYS